MTMSIFRYHTLTMAVDVCLLPLSLLEIEDGCMCGAHTEGYGRVET